MKRVEWTSLSGTTPANFLAFLVRALPVADIATGRASAASLRATRIQRALAVETRTLNQSLEIDRESFEVFPSPANLSQIPLGHLTQDARRMQIANGRRSLRAQLNSMAIG